MNRDEHNRWRAKELFRDAQHEGAEEFGGLWLAANQAAISAVARTDGVFDSGLPEEKALMSICILAALREALALRPTGEKS